VGQKERFLTDLDQEESSDFLITTVGVAGVSLVCFIVILSLLALTERGRKEAKN